jgi:hypothetical protein
MHVHDKKEQRVRDRVQMGHKKMRVPSEVCQIRWQERYLIWKGNCQGHPATHDVPLPTKKFGQVNLNYPAVKQS